MGKYTKLEDRQKRIITGTTANGKNNIDVFTNNTIDDPVIIRDGFIQAIIDGKVQANVITETVTALGDLDITFLTDATKVTFAFAVVVTVQASARVSLFEAITASGGSVKASFDTNRITNNTAAAVLTVNPTVTDTGTLLIDGGIVGAGQKNQAVGGTGGGGNMILKKNTKYLFRTTDLSNANQEISVDLLFTEADSVS